MRSEASWTLARKLSTIIVAGGNAAKVLELAESARSGRVRGEPCAGVGFGLPNCLCRNAGERALLAERRPGAIRILGLVPEHVWVTLRRASFRAAMSTGRVHPCVRPTSAARRGGWP